MYLWMYIFTYAYVHIPEFEYVIICLCMYVLYDCTYFAAISKICFNFQTFLLHVHSAQRQTFVFILICALFVYFYLLPFFSTRCWNSPNCLLRRATGYEYNVMLLVILHYIFVFLLLLFIHTYIVIINLIKIIIK